MIFSSKYDTIISTDITVFKGGITMSNPEMLNEITDPSDISLDEAKTRLIDELATGELSVQDNGWLSQDEIEKELECT